MIHLNHNEVNLQKVMTEYLVQAGFINESEIEKIEEPLRNMLKNIETVMQYPIDHDVFPF
ncbi:hypothetical protein [Paenibacillus sp. GP183]|jgi:hypothetical protein|uniref:hypothetical protein n=1 Tax=Paenibacillus sp. GP183 TaxID=1882751 RepID=UPI00089D0CA8|nr:hypothetical protein [Paenibacillus sp. GP183]SEB72628.1 hypothetical protein SAMN05443246_1707 [Paenibacillus sp. GP183]